MLLPERVKLHGSGRLFESEAGSGPGQENKRANFPASSLIWPENQNWEADEVHLSKGRP